MKPIEERGRALPWSAACQSPQLVRHSNLPGLWWTGGAGEGVSREGGGGRCTNRVPRRSGRGISVSSDRISMALSRAECLRQSGVQPRSRSWESRGRGEARRRSEEEAAQEERRHGPLREKPATHRRLFGLRVLSWEDCCLWCYYRYLCYLQYVRETPPGHATARDGARRPARILRFLSILMNFSSVRARLQGRREDSSFVANAASGFSSAAFVADDSTYLLGRNGFS